MIQNQLLLVTYIGCLPSPGDDTMNSRNGLFELLSIAGIRDANKYHGSCWLILHYHLCNKQFPRQWPYFGILYLTYMCMSTLIGVSVSLDFCFHKRYSNPLVNTVLLTLFPTLVRKYTIS